MLEQAMTGANALRIKTAKAAPELLTAAAVVGIVGVAVASGHDTLKAKAVLENAEAQGLEKKDVALEVGVCYIPTIITGVLAIAAAIGSNRIYAKRFATLQLAYTIVERAANGYKEYIAKELGSHAVEEAKDALHGKEAEAEIQAHGLPEETEGDIYGNTLFWDTVKRKFFRYNIEDLRELENDFNFRLLNSTRGFLTLNDLYDHFDLGLVAPEVGDELGWKVSTGGVHFVHRVMKTKDDQPYFLWDFTAGMCPEFYEFSLQEVS